MLPWGGFLRFEIGSDGRKACQMWVRNLGARLSVEKEDMRLANAIFFFPSLFQVEYHPSPT